MSLCGFLGGCRADWKALGSLPASGSLSAAACLGHAELVLELPMGSAWSQRNTDGFWGQILAMFYLGWCVAQAKLVPVTLCSVPAIFVLFA